MVVATEVRLPDPETLANRVEALETYGDNGLDVQVEVALFRPGEAYRRIRANSAGTKVIYTDADGCDMTFWADDWTIISRRKATIDALRARSDGSDGSP